MERSPCAVNYRIIALTTRMSMRGFQIGRHSIGRDRFWPRADANEKGCLRPLLTQSSR